MDYSFKELYDVVLKTTYPMEINGTEYSEGEVIAAFDKIQLADFSEFKDVVAARGGFDNRGHVFWETTREVNVSFSQGVFSKTQFALMNNAKLLKLEEDTIEISQRETLEVENGKITLKNVPISGSMFVYKLENNEKLSFELVQDKQFSIAGVSDYTKVIVDYIYSYDKESEVMIIGQNLSKGFLSFEGKTRIKDDVTGKTKTAVIKIPKLKLVSQLSIRVGRNSSPVVGQFQGTATPVGARGDSRVMELIYLDDDIDADIV